MTIGVEKSASQLHAALESLGSTHPEGLKQLLANLVASVTDEMATLTYGGIYVSSSAATTIAEAGTAVKAAGTTASLGATPSQITEAATNRLTYTGAEPIVAHVQLTAAVTNAGDGDQLTMYIAKGGTVIAASAVSWEHVTGANDVTVSTQALVALANAEYVEAWIANEDQTVNPTVTQMQMVLRGYVV